MKRLQDHGRTGVSVLMDSENIGIDVQIPLVSSESEYRLCVDVVT